MPVTSDTAPTEELRKDLAIFLAIIQKYRPDVMGVVAQLNGKTCPPNVKGTDVTLLDTLNNVKNLSIQLKRVADGLNQLGQLISKLDFVQAQVSTPTTPWVEV